MSETEIVSPEKKEEARTKFQALYDLSLQMARFGPYLAVKMSTASVFALPWGIGVAGAESVKQGVDTGNEEGVARLTASMVRLGLLGTVHDIVVSLCAQDRADAVGKVTAGLLSQQEVTVVTQITNSLVASGHVQDVVSIGNELISHGNTQIYEALKESDFDLGLLASGGKESGANGVLRGAQEKGSELLENLKSGSNKVLKQIQGEDQDKNGEEDKEEEEKFSKSNLSKDVTTSK